MNELALFAGAGGGLLASVLLGWNTIGAVEIEEYPRNVLIQRQNDGFLDPFPIWDDVRTFDGRPWRGCIDVLSGGFPCQDISAAGSGQGLAGARSGLWFEYLRIIEEARPRFVFAENSPLLRTRGLGIVINGLTSLGYGVRWCVLGAGHVGAIHKRARMWVLASYSDSKHVQRKQSEISYSQERQESKIRSLGSFFDGDGGIWEGQSRMGRVAHGVADRMDRIKAIGNGQVPVVAATAWQILSEGLDHA